MSKPKKNKAAAALAKARWAKVDPKARSSAMARVARARWNRKGATS